MAPREAGGGGGPGCSDVKWLVRSVRLDPDGGEEGSPTEEVFDAVVVANGHYSQPRLPSIEGMEVWPRRQLHSHSYRVPDPFSGEAVVVVGCGESGLDIATELCGVAKEVHLVAKSVEDATTPSPMMSKLLANHAGIRLHPPVDRLREDGTVAFADGSVAVADTVIYCTGYTYSIPFLDTAGLVTVDGSRVGPLYEHTFPPSLAPSLSFIGVPMRVFAPWFFEAQARWVALALSGRAAQPPEEEMLRAVLEDYHTHAIPAVDRNVLLSTPTQALTATHRRPLLLAQPVAADTTCPSLWSGGLPVRLPALGPPAHGGMEAGAVPDRHHERDGRPRGLPRPRRRRLQPERPRGPAEVAPRGWRSVRGSPCRCCFR
jgi:hypothetical protein